ncbi:MAG: M24 family metallopeptidase [Sedimentisphaerales bacterium]|nr:M24 family metallopeptidase [Sedimentisphaerales bacterium]
MSKSDSVKVLDMKGQAQVIYEIIKDRLNTLQEAALAADNLDMWLILSQEDNLDPIQAQLIPLDCWPPILQMIAFVRSPNGIRRFNLCGTDTKDLYEWPYKGQEEPKQYAELNKLLEEFDPKRIGINIGSVEWCAGGLTVNRHRDLLAKIPKKFHDRLVSAEKTCTYFMQSMTQRELDVYADVVALGREMIAYTYSPERIIPGETLITDLRWIYWDRTVARGLELSFLPYFRLMRSKQDEEKFGPDDKVIRPGDIIHCDVGIKYLRYHSDHQELAYVRRSGETDAPADLKAILAQSNRLQDIFMDELTHGQGASGNELLARMLQRAEKGKIQGAKIYSHSIGRLLHEPGPLIGLPWEQKDTGLRGEVKLIPNTCFSMELCSEGPVPSWQREAVRLSIEQEVAVDAKGKCYLPGGRQTEFHLI